MDGNSSTTHPDPATRVDRPDDLMQQADGGTLQHSDSTLLRTSSAVSRRTWRSLSDLVEQREEFEESPLEADGGSSASQQSSHRRRCGTFSDLTNAEESPVVDATDSSTSQRGSTRGWGRRRGTWREQTKQFTKASTIVTIGCLTWFFLGVQCTIHYVGGEDAESTSNRHCYPFGWRSRRTSSKWNSRTHFWVPGWWTTRRYVHICIHHEENQWNDRQSRTKNYIWPQIKAGECKCGDLLVRYQPPEQDADPALLVLLEFKVRQAQSPPAQQLQNIKHAYLTYPSTQKLLAIEVTANFTTTLLEVQDHGTRNVSHHAFAPMVISYSREITVIESEMLKFVKLLYGWMKDQLQWFVN